jgi:hypothetical protein
MSRLNFYAAVIALGTVMLLLGKLQGNKKC